MNIQSSAVHVIGALRNLYETIQLETRSPLEKISSYAYLTAMLSEQEAATLEQVRRLLENPSIEVAGGAAAFQVQSAQLVARLEALKVEMQRELRGLKQP